MIRCSGSAYSWRAAAQDNVYMAPALQWHQPQRSHVRCLECMHSIFPCGSTSPSPYLETGILQKMLTPARPASINRAACAARRRFLPQFRPEQVIFGAGPPPGTACILCPGFCRFIAMPHQQPSPASQKLMVSDLALGAEVNELFIIASAQQGQARNGPYWRIEFRDASGGIGGKSGAPRARPMRNSPRARWRG